MTRDPSDTNDRRRFSRVPCDAPVRVHLDGCVWPSQLVDASLKGVALSVPASLKVDTGVQLDIRILLGPDITLRLVGTVVHAQQGRLGVRWDRIPLASLRYLRRVVELNDGGAVFDEFERLA